MIVAYLDCGLERSGRSIERNPVATLNDKRIALKSGIVTYHDSVGCWIQLDYVQRCGGGNAEALALANRVELDAVVVAKDLALRVDDFAPVLCGQPGLLQKF